MNCSTTPAPVACGNTANLLHARLLCSVHPAARAVRVWLFAVFVYHAICYRWSVLVVSIFHHTKRLTASVFVPYRQFTNPRISESCGDHPRAFRTRRGFKLYFMFVVLRMRLRFAAPRPTVTDRVPAGHLLYIFQCLPAPCIPWVWQCAIRIIYRTLAIHFIETYVSVALLPIGQQNTYRNALDGTAHSLSSNLHKRYR